MKRPTLIAACSFFVGVLLVVSTRTAQSADEPKVEFPEEPRAIFENLVTSRLNVCDDANIVISYFEGPGAMISQIQARMRNASSGSSPNSWISA